MMTIEKFNTDTYTQNRVKINKTKESLLIESDRIESNRMDCLMMMFSIFSLQII